MKSKFVFLILTLILCSLMFVGCQKAQQPAAGPVNLKWAMWDYDLTVYYKPLVDAYQAMNSNVKIECVDLGSADFMTVVSTQLSGGADLDIITIKDIPGYANLVRQNRLEPLNAYIKSANINTALYNGVVEQLTTGGEVYTLPFRMDFWLTFYNKDIFDRAGVPYPSNDMTLDQYDALARRVTSGSGASKIYGAHYHTWRSAVSLFGILDGKNTIVDGNYDFLAPIYNRVLKEQDDGIVRSYTDLRTSGTHYSGVFFNSQTAMLTMGSWFIPTQIAQVAKGEAASKNWGLVKYPHPDGVPAGTTLGTITGISVNRNSKNKDAALKFMQFVSGPEGAAVMAKTGSIPAIMNQDVINSISALPGFPTDANSKAALSVYKTYLEMPLHEKAADIETVLNEEHDAIMTKNKTVAQGISSMNERVGRILGK
jgi:multiple sugar transport system substrate-binding protein